MIVKEALRFIESEEMREYWQTDEANLDIGDWCHIIAQSRVPLIEKAEVLRQISERYPADENEELYIPAEMARRAEFALAETKNTPQGSIFIMTEYWIDYDIEWNYDEFLGDYDKESSTPFATFERAIKHIENEAAECNEPIVDYDCCCWRNISRWDLNDNGELIESMTWFLTESGVIFGFDLTDEIENNFSLGYHELTLSVPFKPGDIVTVDMRPAVDVVHVVVTWCNSHNYNDCCSPGCMYVNKKGYVGISALKHLHFSYRFPNFSPLLRLSLFTEELPEHEAPLKIVSEQLKNNNVNGYDFYDCSDKVEYNRKYHGYLWEDFKAYFNL